MTLVHDAYLFDTTGFVSKLLALINDTGDPASIYLAARETALNALRSSSTVQSLAAAYGGWDRETLEAQLPARFSGDENDICFWLQFLLYESLGQTKNAQPGLGYRWRSLMVELKRSGWTESNAELLVAGRSLSALLDYAPNKGRFATTLIARRLLRNLKMASQGGSVGWLSETDCRALHAALMDSNMTPLKDDTARSLKPVIRAAAAMLEAAWTHRSDLCMIVSG